MNLNWLRPFLIRLGHGVAKNAPHILMGMGTGSAVTAVIFAAKATPKAMQAKKDAEFIKANGGEDAGDTVTGIFSGSMERLTPLETLKACGKYYIPAAGMEIFSLICFWGAHGINVKRQALLAGTVCSMEQILTEYQKKVVEMIGEEPEKEIRTAIAQDHYDRNPPQVLLTPDTDVWCQYRGYRFRGNYMRLREIENEANHELIANLYFSESDLLDRFDPERRWIRPTQESRMLGWTVDRLMEFDILPAWGPNHEVGLEIDIRDKDGRAYLPKPGYSASL